MVQKYGATKSALVKEQRTDTNIFRVLVPRHLQLLVVEIRLVRLGTSGKPAVRPSERVDEWLESGRKVIFYSQSY